MVCDLELKNADLQKRLLASKGLREALAIAQSKVAEGELVWQEVLAAQGEAKSLRSKVKEMEGRVNAAEEARAHAVVLMDAEIAAGKQAVEDAKVPWGCIGTCAAPSTKDVPWAM